jgi:hypothetical protein
MSKRKLERFSLSAILDALNGSDVATARDNLSQLVGGTFADIFRQKENLK